MGALSSLEGRLEVAILLILIQYHSSLNSTRFVSKEGRKQRFAMEKIVELSPSFSTGRKLRARERFECARGRILACD